MRKSWLIGLCAYSILLTQAFPDQARADDWTPKRQGNRIGGEIDWWPYKNLGDRRTYHSASIGVVGQFRVARSVFIDFDAPFSIFSTPADSFATIGNPTVGVHWGSTLTERVSVFAGGSLTMATQVLDRLGNSQSAYESFVVRTQAAESRAYADFHRFASSYFFARGIGGVEIRPIPVLYYRGELALLLAVPVGDIYPDSEFIIEVHNEIEFRSSKGIGGGLHIQSVLFTTDINRNENAQSALEPYFVYEPARGFYARVGTLVALDRPLGFGLDTGRLFVIRASLGGKW